MISKNAQTTHSPQRRPPHEGEASAVAGQEGLPGPPLNEGLPTKGRRAAAGGRRPRRAHPSTKASPRRGGERAHDGARGREIPPSTKASPRRGGEHSGQKAGSSSLAPQRRPPHEGEARGWPSSPSPGCGALNEGLPTKGRRAGRPAERSRSSPLNEGLPTKGRRAGPTGPGAPDRAALNEGLPTKGRRGGFLGNADAVERPSTKASPRRGGETAASRPSCASLSPQRRPPHEGEARARRSGHGRTCWCPQRRPPHEGEASSWT